MSLIESGINNMMSKQEKKKDRMQFTKEMFGIKDSQKKKKKKKGNES